MKSVADWTVLASQWRINAPNCSPLDGDIGKVREFNFDDKHWTIRYPVADTGNWLTRRQVLISPHALIAAIKEEHGIAVALTRKKIENSPPLDTDRPVSRQFEEIYYGYYGWPVYFDGPYMWGPAPYIVRDPEERKRTGQRKKRWDPHLRSTSEVSGYHARPKTEKSGTSRILSLMTRRGRFAILSSIRGTGGRETRSWPPRSGSSESAGPMRASSSISRVKPSETPRNIRRMPC